ncbi:hypothetical protein NKH77_25735 [Streptomyces sp. M19]
MNTALIIPLAIAVVAFVVARQVRGEAVHGRRLLVLPLALAAIGVSNLGSGGHHPGPPTWSCCGRWRDRAARRRLAGHEDAAGAARRGLWVRMPVSGLWLWVSWCSRASP